MHRVENSPNQTLEKQLAPCTQEVSAIDSRSNAPIQPTHERSILVVEHEIANITSSSCQAMFASSRHLV